MSRAAILDIEELHRFIASLGFICGQLREKKARLNSEFKSLRDVWQDKQYVTFEQNFSVTMKQIDDFLKHAEMYSAYLRKKAEIAERYLNNY